MKPVYETHVTVVGGRAGKAASDDGNLSLVLSLPKAFGGEGKPGTNPEQLLAAGYAACFESTLGFIAAGKKLNLESSQIVSTASVFNDPAGGFKLTIDLEIELKGLDRPTAMSLIEEAKKVCPYHKMAHGNIEQTYRLK